MPGMGTSAARVIRSDEIAGERIETYGFRRTVKKLLDTANTTVHVGVFDPGQSGAPHVHPRSEEVTYVVDGTAEVLVDGRTLVVRAGDLFYGPPNVPHQFRNVGNGKLVLVAVYSPPAALPLVSNLSSEEGELT